MSAAGFVISSSCFWLTVTRQIESARLDTLVERLTLQNRNCSSFVRNEIAPDSIPSAFVIWLTSGVKSPSIPLLPYFEAAMSYPLRRLSTVVSAFILQITGFEIATAGTEIFIEGLTVSVTTACDGLTLLQNLLWVSWIVIIWRHTTTKRRLVHMLLVINASFIVNTLRVITLCLLVYWFGPDILASQTHIIIGWLAVLAATALYLAMEFSFSATRLPSESPDQGTDGQAQPERRTGLETI